jgi:hypothetical protein
MAPLRYEHLAIVANAREIAALAGTRKDTVTDATTVLRNYGAEVVVVKDSCRGCLVVTPDAAPIRVSPHPTPSVWPLGSGDVFAAGFAHAWGSGAAPPEAAHVASNSAAWWCGTQVKEVPPSILAGATVADALKGASPELRISEERPTLYLAAPFFTLAERWLVELCRDVLTDLGANVFSPLHDVGAGGIEVARQDLDGLEKSDAVFALLDGDDPGTLYEAGWAHGHDLPIVCFSNQASSSGAKMLVGTGAEIHADLSTALYRAVWAAYGLRLTSSVPPH